MSATRYHLVVVKRREVVEYHGGPTVLVFNGWSQAEMFSLMEEYADVAIHLSLTKQEV